MKKFILLTSCFFTSLYTYSQCQLTTTQNNILCNGQCNGSATATMIGIPPYNYLWQPGNMTTQTVTGLCSGTYTVNAVDNTSCVAQAIVTITQPVVLSSSSTHVNASCHGGCNGSATAFAAGGTSPYTHKWTTSPVQTGATATGLCVGTYRDTITDANGCKTVLAPVTITEPTVLSAILSGGSVSCNGGNNGTGTATPSGGTPNYSYSWSTLPSQSTAIATGLIAGSYTCYVTDANGCTVNGSCTVNQPAVLTYSTSSTNASCSTCCDGNATSTPAGGTAPYTYLWTPGGQTTQNVTNACPGNYTVCVTDVNGCTQCANGSVNYTVGINEINEQNAFHISPNPSSGIFQLTFDVLPSEKFEILVFNVVGENILDAVLHGQTSTVDLSGSPLGIYFITVKTGSKPITKKLIID